MPQEKDSSSVELCNTENALEAIRRGMQPVPLVTGDKRPRVAGWPKLRWENTPEGLEEARQKFDAWAAEGHGGLGVILGEPSGNLVDVDLDHPLTARLKDHFLPRTAMRSGRPSRPNTHYWYRVKPGTLQETRTYRLPNEREEADKRMIVEYRSNNGQTALPGNLHPSGEIYDWGGEPWGGDRGPAEVDGRMLALQVSLLGFCTLLAKYWPQEGGRHDAYLALAGGLLRVGDGIHAYWERNAAVIIGALADATNDDEGPEGRISEVLDSTIKRLRLGKKAAGFGRLGEIIGEDVVRQARVILAEVESIAGLPSRTSGELSVEKIDAAVEQGMDGHADGESEPEPAHDPTAPRDPMGERDTTWSALDLEPYLTGQVQTVEPEILEREDGQCLMYPGRLNMLYGPSESAKSWIAMKVCQQLMERGERVVYLDLEDEPVNSLERMKAIGATIDDLRTLFTYVRPESPLASMQRTRWGEERSDEKSKRNEEAFTKLLEAKDPALIVADGMTVLYGLHGLDSNDSVQTDVITTWLKKLTRHGRSTVIVVDHTAKNPSRGSLPIGSQHKVSMVQGTLLQAFPVKQPMPNAVGEVELIVLKDRPGKVRAASEKSGEKAQLAAKVVMDSTGADTDMSFRVPRGATVNGTTDAQAQQQAGPVTLDMREASKRVQEAARKEAEEKRILDIFEGDIGRTVSSSDIYTKLFGDAVTEKNRRATREVYARLVQQGWLAPGGNSKDRTYTLVMCEVPEDGMSEDDDDDRIELYPS